MTVLDAITLVEGATDPTRFFGAEPARKYRELAYQLHPDTTQAKGKMVTRAVSAFKKLTDMYSRLNGKSHPALRIGKWHIEDPMSKGDIADLYHARGDGNDQKLIFKIARSERDTDLMESEYAHLGLLHKAEGIANFGKYLPKAIAGLEASGRRANVLSASSDGYSLAQLMSLYPHGIGIDFRHIVWMGNRALNALGFVHNAGIVHGAVIPEHLVYGPVSHGLVLVDWCYSVTAESKDHIRARVKARADLYPQEVGRKEPALPQTDIYMLAVSLKAAARNIPRRFQPFFDHCLAESPRSRPQDAWKLLPRWLELAEQEYGPPAYVKLDIPVS